MKTVSSSIITQHWDNTGSGKPSLWEAGTHFCYIIDTMITDDLASCVAKASEAMVLTYVGSNIPFPASK